MPETNALAKPGFPAGRDVIELSCSSGLRDRAPYGLLAIVVALIAGCHSTSYVPRKSSSAYVETTSAFYVGLAALQVGDDVRADKYLAQTTKLAPGEPAGWVDWGILALRQRDFDASEQRLERARKLAPSDDRIFYLLGILESARGNSTQAIADFRQAVRLNPRNIRATYQLALEIERQGGQGSEAEFEQLIETILLVQPDNLAALIELSRIAAKQDDAATLRATLPRIAAHAADWPDAAKAQLATLQAAAVTDPRAAATRTTFLRNVLMRVPSFRQSLSMMLAPPGEGAEPFISFNRMESPPSTPAPPDMAMTFITASVPNLDRQKWNWIGAICLSSESRPVVAVADASQVRLTTGASFPFPGGALGQAPSPEGVLAVDFNYDFKTDLVLAGAGGVRLMRQDSPGAFADVSKLARLPDSILNGSYTGAWAVDIEADGDMDIVLGSKSGLPFVLRNNGDGTFSTSHPFSGISGLMQFVWADFNGDGNPDAALIDGEGQLHVFFNERSGNFREHSVPANVLQSAAIAAGDMDGNRSLDLLSVRLDGRIAKLSFDADSDTWTATDIAATSKSAMGLTGQLRLHVADIDNNGAPDLLLAPVELHAGKAAIWLQGQRGDFQLLRQTVPPTIFDVAGVNDDGRLDLVGLSDEALPTLSESKTTLNYHWQILEPRAKVATGDQRINSFGIGGEIEIRAGLLVQKQPITGPQLHFGLGNQTGADVARIVWPNGSVRAEFGLKGNQQIVTEQRLKGSCPFLFAFNGRQMAFVKDAVPWGSAIGLRINSLGSANISATEEWYKIGGNELVARNGFYDLRITGELWETYYYDYLSLMAVDHPVGTQIYTDERFAVPAVKLAITATGPPHQIARAVDDKGLDVTDLVHSLDGRYLDTFGRGQYQGLTRDHYVEVDLGSDFPKSGPVVLIAKGWLHPSDSSINVAISQGSHERPRALSLEVPDGKGGWRVARSNLGFPAGRKKICLIDLTNVFGSGTLRRVRLRTNLEIYWDSIEWAKALPSAQMTVVRLTPSVADLHYRGYSTVRQQNSSSPEIPDYNQIASTSQIWHDLPGYYTRYGDVRELLHAIDDRYVIMNAGDELSLRFAAPPPPKPGWVRDYVIAGDGWIKDGDYNSTYSQTVLPLPHHSRRTYDSAPGDLEDEWAYKHHPQDWQLYHTRYVTAEHFRDALRFGVEK